MYVSEINGKHNSGHVGLTRYEFAVKIYLTYIVHIEQLIHKIKTSLSMRFFFSVIAVITSEISMIFIFKHCDPCIRE